MTLLEIVLAGTLAAALTGSLHVVLIGCGTAAAELSGEQDALRQADNTLRFLVRRCREAEAVTAIDGDGRGFTIAVGGGETLGFRLVDFMAGVVLNVFDSAAGTNRTLNDRVTSFAPRFYEADAVTPTADPAAARVIEITLTVDLPRDHAPGRTVSSRVWVRRW